MSTTIMSDQPIHTITHAWTGTPGASTSIQYQDGLEVRRNLISNPSFETTSSYFSANNGTTQAWDNTVPYIGSASLRLTMSNVGTPIYRLFDALPAGDTYTFSMYVKMTTDLAAPTFLGVTFNDNNGFPAATFKSDNPIQFATDWTRVSVTFTVPEGTASWFVFLGTGAANTSGTMWIDAMLMESGFTVRPYFDGSTDPYSVYGTSTPLLVDGWEESVETRNVVNNIIGGGVDITPYPADLRSGQYTAVFQDEDDAADLVRMHQQPARFTIQDDDRPSIGMLYVPNGTITRALDDESREFWEVTIPYQEIDA